MSIMPPPTRWSFEISPTFFASPIVCEVDYYEKQNLGAIGLWTLAGMWISGAEASRKRGFVPSNLPAHLLPRASATSALIRFGFWDFAQDDDGQLGYQMGFEGELWRMRPRRITGTSARWIEPARRVSLYERDGWKCQVCGSLDRLSLDHKLPRIRGGGHEDANLWTLCRSCNSRKGTKTVEEWLGLLPYGA